MSAVIDLTLSLKEGMRGVNYETAKTIEKDGWNARTLHLYSHCGTHMDAPVHFGINDMSIDQIKPERFICDAWLINLDGIGENTKIHVEDLGKIKEKVSKGEGLIFRTGWGKKAELPEYRHALPAIGKDLAHWCAKKEIGLIGVEPPSVADVNNMEELTLIHKILLQAHIIIVEGLTNLDAITVQKFKFIALPLKIEGGDGAPARALAII